MTRIAALVVCGPSPLKFAGLDLTDRAIRMARGAGITQIRVVADDHPFEIAPEADALVVLPERAIVEPAALTDLVQRGLHRGEDAAVFLDETGATTDVAILSADAVERVRSLPRLRAAIHRLAVEGTVACVDGAPRFCVRLRDAREIASVERQYLRHTKGGDSGGWFMRSFRRLRADVASALRQAVVVSAFRRSFTVLRSH